MTSSSFRARRSRVPALSVASRVSHRVLAVIVVAALGSIFASGAQAAPELAVMGKEPVEAKASSGKGTAEAFITVLNTGQEAARGVTVSLQASDPKAIRSTPTSPVDIQPGEAKRLEVKLTGLDPLTKPANGQLVVTGGAKPVGQNITIQPAPDPAADWPLLIVCLAFGVAAALMLGVASDITEKHPNGRRLLRGTAPGPKWSFESWASHLTGVGAVLGTTVGLAALPAVSEQIEKETLVELNVLFVGLAAVAPFLYQAFRRRDSNAVHEEEGGLGFTWALLIACWLVLGATLGELTTLGLTAWILTAGGTAGVVIEVGLGILVLLAVYYVVSTAHALALIDWAAVATLAKPGAPVAMVSGLGRHAPHGVHLRETLASTSSRASRHVDIGSEAQAYRMTVRLP